MNPFLYTRRKAVNIIALGISALSAAFGIFFLVWILKDVLFLGLPALSASFFTQLPAPPGME
ncbi:MAG: phosphate ABC transporter permease PtsA, partial [Deltaproteobacteria bacterium]|nr:phosphate ABC transporter permease PtsA [Deltaproteobacteria bacterium]